jgi:hypothetical protein
VEIRSPSSFGANLRKPIAAGTSTQTASREKTRQPDPSHFLPRMEKPRGAGRPLFFLEEKTRQPDPSHFLPRMEKPRGAGRPLFFLEEADRGRHIDADRFQRKNPSSCGLPPFPPFRYLGCRVTL